MIGGTSGDLSSDGSQPMVDENPVDDEFVVVPDDSAAADKQAPADKQTWKPGMQARLYFTSAELEADAVSMTPAEASDLFSEEVVAYIAHYFELKPDWADRRSDGSRMILPGREKCWFVPMEFLQYEEEHWKHVLSSDKTARQLISQEEHWQRNVRPRVGSWNFLFSDEHEKFAEMKKVREEVEASASAAASAADSSEAAGHQLVQSAAAEVKKHNPAPKKNAHWSRFSLVTKAKARRQEERAAEAKIKRTTGDSTAVYRQAGDITHKAAVERQLDRQAAAQMKEHATSSTESSPDKAATAQSKPRLQPTDYDVARETYLLSRGWSLVHPAKRLPSVSPPVTPPTKDAPGSPPTMPAPGVPVVCNRGKHRSPYCMGVMQQVLANEEAAALANEELFDDAESEPDDSSIIAPRGAFWRHRE